MGNNSEKFEDDKFKVELISQARKDFEKTIKVLDHKKTALEEYLIKLDDSKKVVCQESRNRALAEQVELYTREILRVVEQLDPRFKNTFLQSGSFYDEVKVGLPDEYDYMAKLEFLSKPGIAKAVPTKLGFAKVILEDEEAIEFWKEFLGEDVDEDSDEDNDEYADEDSDEVFENVLLVSKLQEAFRTLVMEAIKSVKMPEKWKRDPCPEQHGPCTMLEFLVDDFLPEGLLYMSIDLAPCITYPSYKDVEFPFHQNLKKENSFALLLGQIVANERDVLLVPFIKDGFKISKNCTSIYRPSYREQMRVSFSLVEKDIFGHFACNSIEKRVLRLLKILRNAHLRDDGKRQEWEEPVPDYPPSTIIQVRRVEKVKPPKQPQWFWDYYHGRVGYEEGELSIEKDDKFVRDLLQTYAFKSLFFYTKLFSTNEEMWDPGNLSGSLVECLKLLFNLYSIPNAPVPNFFFDGYTGQNPNQHKRTKILMGLLKVVIYLESAVNLNSS